MQVQVLLICYLYFFFLEKKIVSAAENVANILGGDKTKTTSDLLEKVVASRVEALREEQINTYVDYYALLSTINYTYYV